MGIPLYTIHIKSPIVLYITDKVVDVSTDLSL